MLALPWVPPSAGKAPYLWVFSLLFLALKYGYQPFKPFELAALVVTVLVFLPLYFASFWPAPRRLPWLILAGCLFGVAWAPHNFGASSFFIFAAGMCGGIVPQRRAYLTLAGVLALAAASYLVLGNYPLAFMLPALGIGVPVGVASIMDASLRRSHEKLLRKQEEVEHMATIAERERISRDLHDLLGHTLSLITLKAELAGKLAGRDIDACKKEIGDIECSARNALAEVRSAVTGYRLTGFRHELASARASLDAAGVDMHERVDSFVIPAAAESVMALALREAVTNIIRHAGASRCDVALTQDGGAILFTIADNGPLAQPVIQGNGLAGMQERVGAIGGRLAVRTDAGMALELRLPMGVCA